MSKNLNFFIVVLSVFVFYSCTRKTDPALVDLGHNFSPLETGRFMVYDVKSTLFTTSGKEYEQYQIKEVIKDTLHLASEIVCRLERFYRNSPNDPWPSQPDSVWTTWNNNFQLIRNENNYRYIKLVFPVENNKSWDGNALNVIPDEIYRIRNLDTPYQVGDNYFPKTLSVIQNADSSLLGKDLRIEVFARDIGLVYKKTEKIEYNNQGVITSDTVGGILYYQKLIEHGKE